MSKLIKNWEELSKVPPNDKYKIVVDEDMCSGVIETLDGNFCEYLSTHTFYGKNYKHSTELLQKYGFDIEIDNWDKGR